MQPADSIALSPPHHHHHQTDVSCAADMRLRNKRQLK